MLINKKNKLYAYLFFYKKNKELTNPNTVATNITIATIFITLSLIRFTSNNII